MNRTVVKRKCCGQEEAGNEWNGGTWTLSIIIGFIMIIMISLF